MVNIIFIRSYDVFYKITEFCLSKAISGFQKEMEQTWFELSSYKILRHVTRKSTNLSRTASTKHKGNTRVKNSFCKNLIRWLYPTTIRITLTLCRQSVWSSTTDKNDYWLRSNKWFSFPKDRLIRIQSRAPFVEMFRFVFEETTYSKYGFSRTKQNQESTKNGIEYSI
jgi:hypothetical protein